MDSVDKELFRRTAAEIMGWKVLERPAEWANEAGKVFFFDDDTGKAICGTPFPVDPKVLDPGDPPYHVSWRYWRPFEDDDWNGIVKAVTDKGFIIDLRFGANWDTVKISTQDFYHSVSGTFAHDVTPGRALCEAALLLMDRTKNLLELL